MFLLFVILSLGCVVECSFLRGTVYLNGDQPKFAPGKVDKTGAAFGFYNNTLLETGWGVLDITSGDSKHGYSDQQLAYAVGYFEGIATAEQMYQHYQNMYAVFLTGKSKDVINKLKSFLNDQDSWMRKMAKKHSKSDAFWRHVSYVIAQYDGLYAGYKQMAHKDWDRSVFVVQVLNGVGDLIDLMHKLDPKSRPDFTHMSAASAARYVRSTGHCSALIKVTAAFENIFMSHSSWFVYSATNRIYKHYSFNFKDQQTAAKQMSFSSYPGFLESLDDFYILSSKLVVLQTTNNVFNHSLYDAVVPQTLLAWHRMRVANFMAHGGRQWAHTFKKFNSGTYNNQYMVLDLKKVELNAAIHDDALWVVEQIPTLVEAGDQSSILRAGYWPSYNVPFYENVYNTSGYPDYVKRFGPNFSYQLAPRAKIFRRDQSKVVSLKALQHIMRYNEYKTDPYSDKNPCNTICCRGDLDPKNPRPDGCYDTKVTDYHLALKRRSIAINGPTLGTGLKPFKWSAGFTNVTHVGLPDTYQFPWVAMTPSN